jgi:butyryl-CoA dehydrogenase
MDYAYPPRLQDIKTSAVELVKRFMPYEAECEANGGLSAADIARMQKDTLASGLQAINMPTEWGGAGLSYLEQVVVHEELGKLTNGLWELVWRPANALAAGNPAQHERWLKPCIRGERRDAVAITEPGAGSDPLNHTSTATRVGDRFRLTGEKWFVTAGDLADFLLVLAKVPDEGPTMFLVDKDQPGVTLKQRESSTSTATMCQPASSARSPLPGLRSYPGTGAGRPRRPTRSPTARCAPAISGSWTTTDGSTWSTARRT